IMAGDFADAATLDRMREEWGLNRPLPVQFGVFVGNLVQGDLGNSIRSRQPVLRELGSRLQVTFTLALGSILVTLLIGLVAGIASAVRPYTVVDYTSTVVSLLGVSMPSFWSGLILIVIFSLLATTPSPWAPLLGVSLPISWSGLILIVIFPCSSDCSPPGASAPGSTTSCRRSAWGSSRPAWSRGRPAAPCSRAWRPTSCARRAPRACRRIRSC